MREFLFALGRFAAAFVGGTVMGLLFNVVLVRSLTDIEAGIAYTLAIAFGLIVGLAAAFRLDERV